MFNLISVSLQNFVMKELYERLVKNFMDIIVLKELQNGNPLSGYDVIDLIYKRFHLLISSGTIYSLLYSMERNELIKGMMTNKKRVYRLTERGKETLESISESDDEILLLIKSILGK